MYVQNILKQTKSFGAAVIQLPVFITGNNLLSLLSTFLVHIILQCLLLLILNTKDQTMTHVPATESKCKRKSEMS